MAYFDHLVWDIELLVDTEKMRIENIVYTSLDGNKVMKDGMHLFTLDVENHTIDFGDNFEQVSCSFSRGRSVRPFWIKKSDLLIG
jgi:RecJ-like exonuclease